MDLFGANTRKRVLEILDLNEFEIIPKDIFVAKIGKKKGKKRKNRKKGSPPKMEMLEDNEPEGGDIYLTKYGTSIPRLGKIFSYTFWRTQMNKDIFWSVQGNDYEGIGAAWIATQYFGPPEQARRFLQEITLTHPTETKIQMKYTSSLEEGRNYIFISKNIIQHFKSEDNSFNFEFKIIRLRRRPFPKRRY